jgi:hypothetical protein
MSYEEAEKAIKILEKHRIPARILTYGLPKTSLAFKVDAGGGKFYELSQLKNHLTARAEAFADAAVDIFEASRINKKGIRTVE